MNGSPVASSGRLSVRISVMVLTAVLYAAGKGITAYVPTPFHVGQLLVGIFIPAFLAVVCETLPVAIGAGIGTFLGDVLFLAPFGATTPFLSLTAGVPANFVAFLLFGWFVKRYKSWAGFVAGTVSFVTLGNLIAATLVAVVLPAPLSVIPGLTVFWNATSIPAIIVAVPFLVRAVRPLFGRSRMLTFDPSWVSAPTSGQTILAVLFALIFLVLGVLFFVLEVPNPLGLNIETYAIAAALVLIFAPIAGVVAGAEIKAKASAR